MWTFLAFISALCLGFYDISKKIALRDHPVVDVLNDRSGYSNFEISQHLDMYFRFFGAKDMDIVYLYFLSQKKQDEIMRILGKTQPAISYDVTRIKKQM